MHAQPTTDQCTATPLFALPHAHDPSCIEQQLTEACVLAHQGQLMQAQEAFCRVLDQDATNLDALVSLAHLCRVGRNFAEAVELLEEARRHHPHSADVIAALSLVALDLGYESGARRLLDQLDRLSPGHPERTEILGKLSYRSAKSYRSDTDCRSALA
jgi:Tfp pilus assembly protein PilF